MENKVNQNEKKNNNLTYIIIAIVAVVLIVVILLVAKGCSKSESKNSENEESVEKIGAKEEDIISAYGMSKEDAINLVKTIYNGDNYEFSADINNDSKYIVTVKNLVTESSDKFLVDPTSSSKSFYMITE